MDYNELARQLYAAVVSVRLHVPFAVAYARTPAFMSPAWQRHAESFYRATLNAAASALFDPSSADALLAPPASSLKQ